MTRTSRALRLCLVGLLAALATTVGLAPASADEGSVPRTYQGAVYSRSYPQPPTQGENQSKLWFHADAWWALLVEPTGRSLRVYELMPDHTWRATSAVVNDDVGDVGDAEAGGRHADRRRRRRRLLRHAACADRDVVRRHRHTLMARYSASVPASGSGPAGSGRRENVWK